MTTADDVSVRALGRVEYSPTLAAMQTFTERRSAQTRDELWLLEHPPVYTLGLRVRDKQLRGAPGVAVIATDRGGDVTYHGPGQALVYALMDLQRRQWGIRRLVASIEQGVIDMLSEYRVVGARRAGAPGIYVEGRKIAALGLRVRRGCSYHGVALNIRMDLDPFAAIDPCGYPGLAVTQLADFVSEIDRAEAEQRLIQHVCRTLGYTGRIEYFGDDVAQRRPQPLRI